MKEKNSELENGEKKRRRFFFVQWRKQTGGKRKIWIGDGVASVISIEKNSFDIRVDDVDKGFLVKKVIPKKEENIAKKIINLGVYEIYIDYEIEDANEVSELVQKRIGKEEIKINEKSLEEPRVEQKFKRVVPKNFEELRETSKRQAKDCVTTNSVVMPRSKDYSEKDNTDIYIDSFIAIKLRPHQTEAVKFMYECVMGYKNFKGNGCLLADDMGLGKTLSLITLIWILLKQNPLMNSKSSIVKKVLVCCPVTLVQNWKNEFYKWIGSYRMRVLTFDSNDLITSIKNSISDFIKLSNQNVLIINYEKISTLLNDLKEVNFDLVICDEAHRLKNKSNKALNGLTNLNIKMKIILTGTPIQNDLLEFYTLINFINPGTLGDLKSFQKNFVKPILKSREVNYSNTELKKKGDKVFESLIELTSPFILRRPLSIMFNYLKKKVDLILFVPPTDEQIKLFNSIINSNHFQSNLLNCSGLKSSLLLINTFKKICNSPLLLKNDSFFNSILEVDSNQILENLDFFSSAKFKILDEILYQLIKADEKLVLVSNYTKILDLLELFLTSKNTTFLRLDGSTNKKSRIEIVNKFNTSSTKQSQVFLLSSKSGGEGISLLGASRLILFDNDWNPSVDLQSMSRIHRDGQKKSCFIYRILTTGCIDEKIFQRQLMKINLSSSFLENFSGSNIFDNDELKNLFEINQLTSSLIHDSLECSCNGIGELIENTENFSVENISQSENFSTWISASSLLKKNSNYGYKKKSIESGLKNYMHFHLKKKNLPLILNKIPDKIISDIIIKCMDHSNFSKEFISFAMICDLNK